MLTPNFDSILENSTPEKFATFEELNKIEQARLSLTSREHTFKLTFSEPSLLLKLSNIPTLLHGEREAYFRAESF